MVGPCKFVQETPRISKRKPIRVFVEPRLDGLVVVRTEPHEPRLIGRGVGYWRIGGKHQWKNTLLRAVRPRKRPKVLHLVSFESCYAMWLACRASERWWKHNITSQTWSTHFSHSGGLTKRSYRVDVEGMQCSRRRRDIALVSWPDVRSLRVSASGTRWTFDLYSGLRLNIEYPGGSVRIALRHIADYWFPDAVVQNRRQAIATSRRITAACLIGSVIHAGILFWFFGNTRLVWGMSLLFPGNLIVALPPVVMRFVKWKLDWTISYQRKRRRRTTTPLPSPTTPKDPQT